MHSSCAMAFITAMVLIVMLICGLLSGTGGSSSSQQCNPKLHPEEVPVMYNATTFNCARIYYGSDDPTQACNTSIFRDLPHHHYNSSSSLTRIMSVIVEPGCTYYTCQEEHLWGHTLTVYEEGVTAIAANVSHAVVSSDGRAEFRSELCECLQKMPQCIPEDRYSLLFAADNIHSMTPVTFTYNITAGTVLEKLVESRSPSAAVTSVLKGSLLKLFETKLGVSNKTGHDWTKMSNMTKGGAQFFRTKTVVSPGELWEVEHLEGICKLSLGQHKLFTEIIRTTVKDKDGKVIRVKYDTLGSNNSINTDANNNSNNNSINTDANNSNISNNINNNNNGSHPRPSPPSFTPFHAIIITVSLTFGFIAFLVIGSKCREQRQRKSSKIFGIYHETYGAI